MKNQVNTSVLKMVISDNHDTTITDHIFDFDNNPEGWNCVFDTDNEGAWDEISNEDREERRNNLISVLNELIG